MYSVLNTLSEYTYFCISKKITSYTFLLVFKIVESFQCILKLQEQSFTDVLENGVLKNFAKFTGKLLCWSLFLIKLEAFRPETFVKRDSNADVFL